jgi:transcription initiation factor TFIIE subunit alpha
MQLVNTMSKEDTKMVVTELVGAHALPIIDFLEGKEKISEFIIAEELNMEINETRNILYKLLEHNIVSFLRKKDKIKGWYICYWDFNPQMVPQLKYKILVGKLDKMKERLAQEQQGQYFICKNGCTRLTFEGAVEQNFKCTECGTIMQEQDNTRTKEFLTERIAELEKEVKAAEPKRQIAYAEAPKAAAKKLGNKVSGSRKPVVSSEAAKGKVAKAPAKATKAVVKAKRK